MASTSPIMGDTKRAAKRAIEVVDLLEEANNMRPAKMIMLDFQLHVQVMVLALQTQSYSTFQAPANIVTARSPVIRAAVDQGNVPAVAIDDDTHQLFGVYLQLLCANEIVTAEDETTLSNPEKCMAIVKLYLVALQLEDYLSASTVMEKLASMLDTSPLPLNSVGYAYKHTTQDSPRRRIFVDFVAATMAAERFTPNMSRTCSPEFVYDVVAQLAMRRDSQGLRAEKISDSDLSIYHLGP